MQVLQKCDGLIVKIKHYSGVLGHTEMISEVIVLFLINIY